MDERGYVKIVDRKKDMIIVSGFKVFPNEIEDVVASHPGVVGVRRGRRAGREVGRGGDAVRRAARQEPDQGDARGRSAAKELTGYKRPKYIEFRDELPKTNVGKILRRELRDGALKKAA